MYRDEKSTDPTIARFLEALENEDNKERVLALCVHYRSVSHVRVKYDPRSQVVAAPTDPAKDDKLLFSMDGALHRVGALLRGKYFTDPFPMRAPHKYDLYCVSTRVSGYPPRSA